MYEPLLFVHSWTRWIVFFATLAVCTRGARAWLFGRSWSPVDSQLVWALQQAFMYQILFGLVLYLGLSPFPKAALRDFESARRIPEISFWALYHGPLMLLAYAIFFFGMRVALNRSSSRERARDVTLSTAASLAAMVAAIPWPFLEISRPWIRGFW